MIEYTHPVMIKGFQTALDCGLTTKILNGNFEVKFIWSFKFNATSRDYRPYRQTSFETYDFFYRLKSVMLHVALSAPRVASFEKIFSRD